MPVTDSQEVKVDCAVTEGESLEPNATKDAAAESEGEAKANAKGEAKGTVKGKGKAKCKAKAKAKAKAKGKVKSKAKNDAQAKAKAKAKTRPQGRPKGSGKGKTRTVRPLGAKARVAVAKAKWAAGSVAKAEGTAKKSRTGEHLIFAGRRPPQKEELRTVFLAMRSEFHNLDKEALQLKLQQQHDFFKFVRDAMARAETLPCAVAAYVQARTAELAP
jgi:hypothetical protein